MMNRILIFLVNLLLLCFFAKAQVTKTFVDIRDNKIYKTIKIGKQTWMAENLNYDAGNGSWIYDNSSSNAATYGRLYDWKTACYVCPDGWHLPSDAEWKELEVYLGMSQSEADNTGWRGTNEGSKLKSMSGWNSDESCTNESGFSSLPAGNRNNGSFQSIGTYAGYWSSTEYSSSNAWYRPLGFRHGNVYRNNYKKDYGISVRCVND